MKDWHDVTSKSKLHDLATKAKDTVWSFGMGYANLEGKTHFTLWFDEKDEAKAIKQAKLMVRMNPETVLAMLDELNKPAPDAQPAPTVKFVGLDWDGVNPPTYAEYLAAQPAQAQEPRQWVEPSDEEIEAAWEKFCSYGVSMHFDAFVEASRAVLALAKERNQ